MSGPCPAPGLAAEVAQLKAVVQRLCSELGLDPDPDPHPASQEGLTP